MKTGEELAFRGDLVSRIRRAYAIKTRYDRLREQGMLTVKEVAEELQIHHSTVNKWAREGLLKRHAANDKTLYLYEPLGAKRPIKQQGKKLKNRSKNSNIASENNNEVHRET